MKKITLNFPFIVNDQEVKEITYDYKNFQTGDYLAALSRYKGSDNPAEFKSPFSDYALQFALGVNVILASNREKGWTAEDFSRVTASDLWQITQVGLVFFAVKPDAQPENS